MIRLSMNKGEYAMNLNESTDLVISLFVYGTLKKGGRNHERFCRNATGIQGAKIWGHLYDLPAGYPALEVPENTVLANGTRNPLVDAETQKAIDISKFAFNRPKGDWRLVKGEILTFSDPRRDLPAIDRLEGFYPGRASLYMRVLIIAQTGPLAMPVWVYYMDGLKIKEIVKDD